VSDSTLHVWFALFKPGELTVQYPRGHSAAINKSANPVHININSLLLMKGYLINNRDLFY